MVRGVIALLLGLVSALLTGFANANDSEACVDASVQKQWTPALSHCAATAKQGDAASQFNLGLMYVNGWGVAKDYEEAVRWYRLAAEQGRAEAQLGLGVMYNEGRGVKQDYKEAVRWYRLAATHLCNTGTGSEHGHTHVGETDGHKCIDVRAFLQ